MTVVLESDEQQQQKTTNCARCDRQLNSINSYFCAICVVDMIPKIYPCKICNREYSASSVVKFCNNCIPIDFAIDSAELRRL